LEESLAFIEFTFSRTDPDSELYKLNQMAGLGEEVAVSDNLYYVIDKALSYAELTDGRFDPTVGPLVELWGINTEKFKVPTENEIQETLELVDYKLVVLNEEKY